MLILLCSLMYAVCMAEEVSLKVAKQSNFTLECRLNGTFLFPQWKGPPNFKIYSSQNNSQFNPDLSSVTRLNWAPNRMDLVITNVQKSDEGSYQCVYHGIGVQDFGIMVVDSLNETSNRTIDFPADEEVNRTYVPLLIVLWLLLCTIGIFYLRVRKRHGNEFLELFAKNLKTSPKNPKAVLIFVSCYVLIGWAVMFVMVLYKIGTKGEKKTNVPDEEMPALAKEESAVAAEPSTNTCSESEKLLIQNEADLVSVPVELPPSLKPPSTAPLSLIWEEHSVNWISVKWKAVPKDKGIVDGYKVKYSKVDDTSSEKAAVKKTTSDTRIKLDNLEPSVLYHIQVGAFNAAGDGPMSIGVEVETLNFEIEAFGTNPLAGNIYMKAMKDGAADVDRHLRVIVVGNSGHGKTSLTHQLLGIQDVANPNKTVLHTNYCSVSGSGKWELYKKPSELVSYVKQSLLISILDFSEQSLFNETYHMFHGKNTIYLIVFDMSKLSDCTLVEFNSKEHEQHCLKFWVDSLCSFMGSDDLHELPIIFVGTHKDTVKDNIEITSVLSQIFPATFKQTEHNLYVVDNIQANEQDIIKLRKSIETKFTQHYRSGLPKSWLELEQSIMDIPESQIITQEQLFQLNSQLLSSIKYQDEIEAFLEARHYKGILTHFNEPALCKYTVKNPEYLLNAFSMVFMPEKRCLQMLPQLQLYIDRLKQQGYLENVLLNAFLDQHESFKNDKEIVVKFLQRFHLLCEVSQCKVEKEKESSSFYIVPSMLSNRFPHKSVHAFEKESKPNKLWNKISREKENKLVKENKVSHKKLEVKVGSKSSTLTALVYAFKHLWIATTMYHRVTAVALGLWPLLETKSKHLLCKHFGVYKICEDHAGVISIYDNMIELRILNQSNKHIDGKYGDLFRRVVERTIKREFERTGKKEMVYDMHVRCLDGSGCKNQSEHWHDIVDGNIPFTDTSDNEAYSQWFFALNDFQAYSDTKLTEAVCSKMSRAIKVEGDFERFGKEFLGLNIELIKAIQKTYNHSHVMQVFNLLKTSLNGHLVTLQDLLKLLRSCVFLNVKLDWDIIKNVLDELDNTDAELVKVTTL